LVTCEELPVHFKLHNYTPEYNENTCNDHETRKYWDSTKIQKHTWNEDQP